MIRRHLPRLLSALLLLCLLLVCTTGSAQPAAVQPTDATTPRIGVVTMLPGEVFFERFGHDALVVLDPASGQATSYNFGFFDPSEPDFIGNFVRGRMMYYLVALPLEEDLAQYRDAGRGASLQWLDLPPQQARQLADALAEHAKPENARYRYDYFTANCATMVRDSLDQAMGGGLQSQLAGRSRGNTYRSESVRLASPSLWMWLGFDLGLGPFADRPLSRWQEASCRCAWPTACAKPATVRGAPWYRPSSSCCRSAWPPNPRSSAVTGGHGCWWGWQCPRLCLRHVANPGRWPRSHCRSGCSAVSPVRC